MAGHKAIVIMMIFEGQTFVGQGLHEIVTSTDHVHGSNVHVVVSIRIVEETSSEIRDLESVVGNPYFGKEVVVVSHTFGVAILSGVAMSRLNDIEITQQVVVVLRVTEY